MREGALIPRNEAKEMYNLEDISDLRLLVEMKVKGLKVHKREKFFGSDFEFFPIL
jgi:hypothetical protein